MPVEQIKNALTPSDEPDLKFVVQQSIGSALRIGVPTLLTAWGVDTAKNDGSITVLIVGLSSILASLAWSVFGRLRLLVTEPGTRGVEAKAAAAAAAQPWLPGFTAEDAKGAALTEPRASLADASGSDKAGAP